MNEPRKRPSALWLLFYGRRRRGFPWLLVGTLLTVFVLALVFALPGGPDLARLTAVVFLLLVVGALVIAVVAVVRPRRRP